MYLVNVLTPHPEGDLPVVGLGQDLTTPRMLELNRQMEDANIASMKRYLEAAAT